jgi:hypothetical protein
MRNDSVDPFITQGVPILKGLSWSPLDGACARSLSSPSAESCYHTGEPQAMQARCATRLRARDGLARKRGGGTFSQGERRMQRGGSCNALAEPGARHSCGPRWGDVRQ